MDARTLMGEKVLRYLREHPETVEKTAHVARETGATKPTVRKYRAIFLAEQAKPGVETTPGKTEDVSPVGGKGRDFSTDFPPPKPAPKPRVETPSVDDLPDPGDGQDEDDDGYYLIPGVL